MKLGLRHKPEKMILYFTGQIVGHGKVLISHIRHVDILRYANTV